MNLGNMHIIREVGEQGANGFYPMDKAVLFRRIPFDANGQAVVNLPYKVKPGTSIDYVVFSNGITYDGGVGLNAPQSATWGTVAKTLGQSSLCIGIPGAALSAVTAPAGTNLNGVSQPDNPLAANVAAGTASYLVMFIFNPSDVAMVQ